LREYVSRSLIGPQQDEGLTVFAFEYFNVCTLALTDGLLVAAVDFEEVFEAFALRVVVATCLLPLVSAIALRFGGIVVGIRLN
jgi:hypothetical protein